MHGENLKFISMVLNYVPELLCKMDGTLVVFPIRQF